MSNDNKQLLKPASDESPRYPHKLEPKMIISRKNHSQDLRSPFEHRLEKTFKKGCCVCKSEAVN